jgi:hypothetical protein
MLDNQGHGACNHQQKGKPAEAVVAVVPMTVMVVMAMMMAPMTAVIFSQGAAVILRFIQREFITYDDIQFAHSIFLKVAAQLAAGRISS